MPHAAVLLNITPTAALDWITPFEAVFGYPPDCRHLLPFGCRAYALIKTLNRGEKMTSRAIIGYYIGFDSTNIYHIWIPSQQRVIRTRDAIFNQT